MFCYQLSKDHNKSDLIWNHKTRQELKEALEAELRALNCDKELGMTLPISWNHSEFEVIAIWFFLLKCFGGHNWVVTLRCFFGEKTGHMSIEQALNLWHVGWSVTSLYHWAIITFLRDVIKTELNWRTFVLSRVTVIVTLANMKQVTLLQVRYGSLADEVKIGDYYLRILLDEADRSQELTPIQKPLVILTFFNVLLFWVNCFRCFCKKRGLPRCSGL